MRSPKAANEFTVIVLNTQNNEVNKYAFEWRVPIIDNKIQQIQKKIMIIMTATI